MNDIEKRKHAKEFAERWKDRGDERQETQLFWMELMQDVFGVQHPSDFIQFEVRSETVFSKKTNAKRSNFKFKDAVINRFKDNEVLIEQKSHTKRLDEKIKQSDGEFYTPFEQAKRYDNDSTRDDKARWIITCNFQNFWIYDMEKSGIEQSTPIAKLALEDLPKHLNWLEMILPANVSEIPNFTEEIAVSEKAGELVGEIYDALHKNYVHPESVETYKDLNVLCVRLVFCLYAEDSGLFEHGEKQFHDYLAKFPPDQMRQAILTLFKVLNTPTMPKELRENMYLSDELSAFPYVNGGLFEKEITVPRFTDEIKDILLNKMSLGFDWSSISPTIFGAVFESTLNQKTRREGGMHYTSIENIHKVIDPLFLSDLQKELELLKANASRTKAQLLNFQNKISHLKFLDPTAGSGNFLTETYLSLRRMENEVIRLLNENRSAMAWDGSLNPIKVSIQQFYGIEINDFAVSVAQTALWIAEHEMFKETEEILQMKMDFLPLETFTHIHEENALRMDWKEVIDPSELNYIMGNPPFVGFTYMSKSQKEDMKIVFPNIKNLDFVAGWYKKASDYIQNTKIECGFVSTNSITQGETVARLWHELNVVINYACKTFIWNSEANQKAHVHCVVIGFACFDRKEKKLFEDNEYKIAKNINAYLSDAPNLLIDSRNKPLCNIPKMIYGNKPADGGYLIIEDDDYNEFVKSDPNSIKYIRPLLGASEYLHNKKRWCLWLKGVSPSDIKNCKPIYDRVQKCKNSRENSVAAGIRKFAKTPALFAQITQPDNADYIIVPRVSSERRRYIPIGFLKSETIVTDAVQIIPNADLFEFGIVTSSVHMAWMRTVAGRLKSDYRYSKDVVYNNFPWPTSTDDQKKKIEQTSQSILDARALYPNSSLADLYDPNLMPIELVKAHEANDKAVMQAYGFKSSMSESEIVAELMKMYQELVEKKKK